jgi:GAF domain-containing protein
MPRPLRLLVVEDNLDDAELVAIELRRGGFAPEAERVETAEALRGALDRETWDAVVSDFRMPAFTGLEALGIVRERDPDVPFILISGVVSVDTAIEVLRAGAQDYVSKDQLSRLATTLDRDLAEAAARQETKRLAQLTEALQRINNILLTTLDLDEMLQKVAVGASKAVGAERADVALLEGDEWVVKHVLDLPAELVGARFSSAEMQGLARVARTMEPLLVESAQDDERVNTQMAIRFGVASVMIVPLVVEGEAIGAVEFFFVSPRRFGERDQDFALAALAALSLALENSRLFEREKRAAALSRLLNDIYGTLSVSVNPEELMVDILSRVALALGASAGEYATRQEGGWATEAVHGFDEGLLAGFRTDEESPALMGAYDTAEPVLVPDVSDDPRVNAAQATKSGYRACMTFPMRLRREVFGAITFFFDQPRRAFAAEDIDFVGRLAVTLTLAIENERLYAQERRIADTLQESMLWVPRELEGLELGQCYASASDASLVGGDFYDIFEVDTRRVALMIGDVSGKGLEASAMTALVKNSIRTHVVDGRAPGEAVAKTSETIFRFSSAETFVTGFLGLLDRDTGALEYTLAGHPPPLLLSPGAQAKPLPAGGPLMGAYSGAAFSTDHATLERGDTLVLYTDGLVEARRDGALFGEDRLRQFAGEVAGHETTAIPEELFTEVNAFAGGEFKDDVAIVAVRLPSASASRS